MFVLGKTQMKECGMAYLVLKTRSRSTVIALASIVLKLHPETDYKYHVYYSNVSFKDVVAMWP